MPPGVEIGDINGSVAADLCRRHAPHHSGPRRTVISLDPGDWQDAMDVPGTVERRVTPTRCGRTTAKASPTRGSTAAASCS